MTHTLWQQYASLILTFLVAGSPALAAERPNIVVILADDLGYADLGVHGSREIPTPNIDGLARSGVRCTSGYVSCPYCSPTRAGLLTGRYQQRFGHEFNPNPTNPKWQEIGLPVTETTLADHLMKSGYATGLVGKWHLGFAPRYHPQQRGFQEFFGFLAGSHSYFPGVKDNHNLPILRGNEIVNEPQYLTDALAREAESFIASHAQGRQPFFLYLAFNAVHTPMHATPEDLSKFSTIADERRRTYDAMTVSLDRAVGRVLSRLDEANLRERTLIFFFSDNGGPQFKDMAANGSLNTPLRGSKGQTLEGGIRVPYFVNWRKTLPAGRTYDLPVIQLDILPTVLAAAGVELPKVSPDEQVDGVNLLPYLLGQKTEPPHEALYWRFGLQTAIRKGNWKLVTWMDRDSQQYQTNLFDLAADLGEANDLASAQPDRVTELKADWQQWNAGLVDPLWLANNIDKP